MGCYLKLFDSNIGTYICKHSLSACRIRLPAKGITRAMDSVLGSQQLGKTYITVAPRFGTDDFLLDLVVFQPTGWSFGQVISHLLQGFTLIIMYAISD